MVILIKFRWRFIDFVNYIIYFSWRNLSENHTNRISRNKILRFIQEHAVALFSTKDEFLVSFSC